MRRIISLLSDYRAEQLREENAPDKRIQECREMFTYMDGLLSNITPTSTNSQLAEVMTSGDFTYAIQTFIQRLMLPAYQVKRFNFEPLVWPDTVTNFLAHNRYQRRAGLDDLEHVGEKGQARPGSVVDATERKYNVHIWQKQFDFNYQTLVNDDMGYLQDHATEMGISARRTLEKHVSNWIFNATNIARLTVLGALYQQNGRLTTARISEARMAFNQRTEARGNPIAAQLRYIVHHAGLVDTVAQIQASTLVPELATNAQNVVRGTFVPIEDPHLAGTAPNLPWMALTDYRANNIRPLVLARLSGWTGPMLVRKRSDIERITSLLGGGAAVPPIMGDFDTGNVVVKVMDCWGTYIDTTDGNMFDHRGFYYSSGTAP
jgi:hypothetical protein